MLGDISVATNIYLVTGYTDMRKSIDGLCVIVYDQLQSDLPGLNREDILMTYLEDGRCSLSNNLSENCIRPVTVDRKNWLFSDTPDGATANSLYLTIVEMAKAYNLNLYEYLKYPLEQRPNKNMSDDELANLAPWSETVQDICSNKME